MSTPGDLVEERRASARIAKREELQKFDAEALTKVGWVDKSKDLVRIPISEAKALLVADLLAHPRAPIKSAIKIEPSLPVPQAFEGNSAEPLPPALPSAPQGADTILFDVTVPVSSPSAAIAPSASISMASASLQAGSLIHTIVTPELNQ